jgi:IclR family transcriptional regulator, pca regulon regulatory protein
MPRQKAQGSNSLRPRSDAARPSDALFIASLEKGLRVLYAFRDRPRSLSLTEIAAATGMGVSAAQRFVHTWQKLGYLRKDPHSRRYTLAPKLLDFSFMYQRTSGLAEIAMPHLMALGDDCQETVNLMEPDGPDLLYVVRLPRHEIRYPSGIVGARVPAFSTSGGRAILAYLPAGEVERILDSSDLTPRTPLTATDRQTIRTRIAEARRLGYAVVDQEGLIGEISVAAPILDYTGRPIAAVSMPVPTTRWSVEQVHERLAPRVLATARTISRACGSGRAFHES